MEPTGGPVGYGSWFRCFVSRPVGDHLPGPSTRLVLSIIYLCSILPLPWVTIPMSKYRHTILWYKSFAEEMLLKIKMTASFNYWPGWLRCLLEVRTVFGFTGGTKSEQALMLVDDLDSNFTTHKNKPSMLTHWGRNKVDAISQTTFWSTFSWTKMFQFRITFHWSLFLRVQLTIIQHWFRYWLGAVQAKSHIWTNDGQITDAYMRHSASLS